MANQKTAFVLGGGGARGALQVGALQALLEKQIYPRSLVGASVGAINSAYLAIKGLSLDTIQSLAEVWEVAAQRNLLPSNPIRLFLSTLLPSYFASTFSVLKEIFANNGLDPDLRFKDIPGQIELTLVATDLVTGNPYLFGNTVAGGADETILDAVLASACLPPWMRPRPRNGKLLVDGGVVSGLPIETAVSMGATDIYALDLSEQPGQEHSGDGWRRVFDGVILSSMAREKRLEISLAKLQGANLHVLPLLPSPSISISNFHSTHALIRQGYETTRQNLLAWEAGEILPVNA